MHYVREEDRNQMEFISLDSEVDPKSTARLIDAFVDSLDLSKYGFRESSEEGRPAYNPKSLLKLYIYGSRKDIRSSRKLAESCRINLEVRWLMGKVTPDFRTISDFRKNNIQCIKKVFHEFNRRISGAVEWGFTSVDGSKIQANNSKDNNFTRNKLDDRIENLDKKANDYLHQINEIDKREASDEAEEITGELTREELQAKLEETEERLEKYRGYQKIMEETGASQLSVTDMDSRLMKDKNGFKVSYNAQTAVDSETHLIRDCEVSSQVTDHGLIAPVMQGIREESQGEVLEIVADKGYEKEEDIIACLEEGIIPNVIPGNGKDEYELEIPYEESDDADVTSTAPEELKECLHSGRVPEAYQDIINGMEVVNVRRRVAEPEDAEADIDESGTSEGQKEHSYGTEEEMRARAMEGYFVRDPEKNLVYCPAGNILRQKCLKKDGNIRYANKTACKHCPYRDKCFEGKGEWKEIDFTKDGLEKPCRKWLKEESRSNPEETGEKVSESIDDKAQSGEKKAKKKFHYTEVKVVRFRFRPDRRKMSQRLCLSEHPFATIKRSMGGECFLLRGLQKVEGEFSLMCLGYNIERAKNLLGFDGMMRLMTEG